MPVERNTPQLVKKGKGKKRPGYAGWNPGAGSPGTTKSGKNKNTGSTGRERGADRNRNQRTTKSRTPTTGPTNIHTDNPNAPAPYTFIGGKKYNVTPETKAERNRAELRQQLTRQPVGGNRIDRLGNTKKSLFRGGGGGIGSLLTSLFGLAMGIPGLGLLTGGFGRLKEGLGSLNDKIQSTDFARSTSLMDYLDAKKYGGIDARDRAASKNMREAKGIQTAMDMRPTTLDPREMARMGLQMPTAPMSKPTFSDPFRNTVGTTTKVNTTNDAVSSNSIPTVNGVPMIDTGSVYQDNLNFFDNLNKGIVVNNEPPMVNTDNVMQGSVLDAQPKKGIMQTISDLFFTPAGAAEVRPAIGMENTGLGFSIPTGDVGLNASGRLGNLSATVDAMDVLKGESVNPQINYSGDFGNTTAYGNFSDDVQNLGLNFNNDKGLSGGISYDAITGEPRFDIGFRRTFADGGLASMFTRRG